jgi:hypothetical protein
MKLSSRRIDCFVGLIADHPPVIPFVDGTVGMIEKFRFSLHRHSLTYALGPQKLMHKAYATPI